MVVAEKDETHILLKPPLRPVTIRHLLSHTSGLTGMSELQQVTGADGTPLKARALELRHRPAPVAAGREVRLWQPGDECRRADRRDRQRHAL